MNIELRAAGELLAELRDAYRTLSPHLQGDVANVLRTLAQELPAEGATEQDRQTAGAEME